MHRSKTRRRASVATPIRRVIVAALAAVIGLAGVAAAASQPIEPRSIDGTGNNLADPTAGAALSVYTRLDYGPTNPLGNAYANGLDQPARPGGPNPREVSNVLSRQTTVIPEPEGFNEMVAWWLFHLHIDIAAGGAGAESAPIPVPAGDDPFDLAGTGTEEIAFRRSLSVTNPTTGTREIINAPTAFLDADPIYRNSPVDHAAVRTGVGGQLLMQPAANGELIMPSVTFVQAVSPGAFADIPPFVAPAFPTTRAPFAPGAAIDTLLIREHNRVAGILDSLSRGQRNRLGLPRDRDADPQANDQAVFDLARRIVEAEVQAITYGEVLPALGIDIDAYAGYDDAVSPSVFLEFATGPMRVHTMLNRFAQRIDESGASLAPVDLAAVLVPGSTYAEWSQGGIDPVIRGMLVTPAQRHDLLLDEGLRSVDPELFFGTAGDLNDLMASHINRGRDRGVPDYGEVRRALGLAPVTSFADVTSDVPTQTALGGLYSTAAEIDPIVGMLAEDRAAGSLFGETAKALYELQFQVTRDSDRLWHQSTLDGDSAFRSALRRVGLDIDDDNGLWELDRTLADLIRDTTSVGGPGDVVSLDGASALMTQ